MPENLTKTYLGSAGVQVIVDRIKANASAIADQNTNLAVTLAQAETPATGYAATYNFSQGGTNIGTINIPKDFLVKSGTVQTATAVDTPVVGLEVGDKYLDFVVNSIDGGETDQHIYIPVQDLVDIYTGGSTNSVQVTIGNDNTITANVKVHTATGAEAANMLTVESDGLYVPTPTPVDITGKADKVTGATNGNFAGLDANGNLTDSGAKASDFATAAQGALADSAVQSVSLGAGSANGTLKLTVDGTAGADVAVPGLGSAAYTNSNAYDAAGAAASALSDANDYTDAAIAEFVEITANDVNEMFNPPAQAGE